MRGFQPAKAPAKAQKLAQSAMVRGPGTATSDDVPDKVPEGTFIMPADSTAQIGPDKLAAMGAQAGEPEEPGEAAEGETPAQEKAEEDGEAMGIADDGEVGDEEGGEGQGIPVNLSNGEFKMSPEQVQAIGAAVLKVLKNATHTPVRGLNAAPERDETRSFFADGGVVEDPKKNPATPPATAAAAPSNPPVAASPEQLNGLYQKWQATKAPWYLPTPKSNPEERAAEAEFTKAVTSRFIENPPATTPPATTPKAAVGFAPETPAAATRPVTPPAAINKIATEQAAPTSNPQYDAKQVMPGIYRSGNSYSDSPTGAAPSSQPSAQDVAAADALSQRYQQEAMARMLSAQQQPTEPQFSPRGFTPAPDPNERNALVKALSTPMKGAQNGQITASQRQGMLSLMDQEARAVQARANNDVTLQQAQMQTGAQRDVAAMRELGDTGRAVMRETGETGRANSRNAIDQGRLGLESQVRGFDIRDGQRKEALYQKYSEAKTPEEKASLAQELRDLSGKQHESPWKLHVTPTIKNMDGSTTEGSVIRQNTQTGQVERVDLSNQPTPLAQNPKALAIKNNTNMTREQKAAALKQLGY